MVIPILLVFLGFFVVFYSSVIDLFTTYLPERTVKYSVVVGLASWLVYGFTSGNFEFFITSLKLTVLSFAIGGILYFAKSWASGDLWLLAVASSLLSPAFPEFWPKFFVYAIFWMGIIGTIYFFYFFIKHKIYTKHKALSLALLLAIAVFVTNPVKYAFLAALALLTLILWARHDIDELFIIEKDAKDLEEDDWLLQDLLIKGKTIKASMPVGKKEVELASKYGKGKIQVKTGVPMTPAFSLALITLLFF